MDDSPRFLLLSCSQRKNTGHDLLPALERYNGPQFQVVRKYLRLFPQAHSTLDMAILSARFGLIKVDTPIPAYDQPLTAQKAAEIQPQIVATLKQILSQKPYRHICISLGSNYLRAVEGIDALFAAGVQVTYTHGSHGKRLAMLSRWLYPDPSLVPTPPLGKTGQVRLRGVKLDLSPEQVLEQARHALASAPDQLVAPQYWYVAVGDQHVSPKWLVSHLTGLPRTSFGATEARRVLMALGIKVQSS